MKLSDLFNRSNWKKYFKIIIGILKDDLSISLTEIKDFLRDCQVDTIKNPYSESIFSKIVEVKIKQDEKNTTSSDIIKNNINNDNILNKNITKEIKKVNNKNQKYSDEIVSQFCKFQIKQIEIDEEFNAIVNKIPFNEFEDVSYLLDQVANLNLLSVENKKEIDLDDVYKNYDKHANDYLPPQFFTGHQGRRIKFIIKFKYFYPFKFEIGTNITFNIILSQYKKFSKQIGINNEDLEHWTGIEQNPRSENKSNICMKPLNQKELFHYDKGNKSKKFDIPRFLSNNLISLDSMMINKRISLFDTINPRLLKDKILFYYSDQFQNLLNNKSDQKLKKIFFQVDYSDGNELVNYMEVLNSQIKHLYVIADEYEKIFFEMNQKLKAIQQKNINLLVPIKHFQNIDN